jgi:hypothetical protein
VKVIGGESVQHNVFEYETWLYQLKGDVKVTKLQTGEDIELKEGSCMIIPPKSPYQVERPKGSIGMKVEQDPTGNAPDRFLDDTPDQEWLELEEEVKKKI